MNIHYKARVPFDISGSCACSITELISGQINVTEEDINMSPWKTSEEWVGHLKLFLVYDDIEFNKSDLNDFKVWYETHRANS